MAATGFLPPATLARLRALRARKRTATCAVQRRTTTIGAGGVKTQTWANVAGLVDLRCGFESATDPREAVAADATRATSVYAVDFDVNAFTEGVASIQPQDRLSITHRVRGLASPFVLSVIGDDPEASDEIGRVVLAERVQPGGA